MQTIYFDIPDITQYVDYISPMSLEGNVTVLVVFKQLYRSDDVLLDIYLNEITNDTKIVSSKLLTPNTILSAPNFDIGFEYYIECVDPKDSMKKVTKYNTKDFQLKFTKYEDE